ncbi:hypothetical protein F5Y03DRAFT_344700 [Xylaria venustula]|nr:hypothetical protein F5Y03DRAFT_344700 [Xylaria venustula]
MLLKSDQALYQPRRSGHRVEEPSQPWTTARCHRLLRPLISRITSLRKDVSLTGQTTAPGTRSTSGTALASSISKKTYSEQFDSEATWLMPKKKRPRLTYSQRRGTQGPQSQSSDLDGSNSGQVNPNDGINQVLGTKSEVTKTFRRIQRERQKKAIAPGEIIPSTPILRRARGKIALSPIAPVHELNPELTQAERGRERFAKANFSTQKRLEERLASLRDRFCSKYADLEAIYRSLEAILRATATDINVVRGPRSFLEMCLRRVPQYIAELEAWERFDAEESGTVSTLDDIDTSAQVYNELESLGTNVGWRHLRVAVRAEGLNAVKHAMREGLFDEDFSQLIIDLCVHLGAASEAEDLIAALVDRQYPQPASTRSQFTQVPSLQPLVTLNSFASQTKRVSFLFRQYSILLSSGSLPTEWLATTDFERIWSLAVQELVNDHPHDGAMSFITQSILLLCCQKRLPNNNIDTAQLEQDMARASQRTLMSALSILASMCLLGETRLIAPGLPESNTCQVKIISFRSKHVMRACINELRSYTRSRRTPKLEILYVALFLSSAQDQSERIDARVKGILEKLSTRDIRTQNHYDNIAWLIASIARACGRATSVASHQCLDGFFGRMESLELDQNLLDKLKAAAAFLIAQQTNNVKDLLYAESLHPHVRLGSGPTDQQRQSDNTIFTGYRWEETIGEWVTVSPVQNKRRGPPILRRHVRSSTPTKGVGNFLIRSDSSASTVTDYDSNVGVGPSQGLKDREHDTSERIQHPCEQQSIPKKRPRRLRSAETLTTRLETEILAPQKNLSISGFSGLAEGRVDSDKENSVRHRAKKPRRSSGRIVLGARSSSYDPIRRRDTYSDDELCI